MRYLRVALAQLLVLATIGAVNVPPLQQAEAIGFQQSLQHRLDGLVDSLVALEPGVTIANQPPPGIIDTIAGQAASRGFSGDGGPSADAVLNQPAGLAFDVDGNLYVADAGNLRVRRIDAATGVITTVAGGGTSTPWVGNGPATTAYLSNPRNVRVLPDGDLYIADSSKIRKVDLDTGTISTVAGSGEAFCCSGFAGDGGPATGASLRTPHDMAMAPNGDLYISDYGNQVIRRVDGSTGVISTYAGTPGIAGFGGDGGPASAALFAGPRSLAIDGDTLYVSDSINARIRRIDLASGTVSTFAGGPGSAGLIVDGSPATSGSIIRPYGLAVDLDGDLYVAENGMSRVRRIDATTGIMSTVVGTSTGDCGDGGPSIQACISGGDALAIAPNGVLALHSQNRIALVTPGTPPDPVTDPTLSYARGGCCSPNRLVVGWTPPTTAINRVLVTTSPGGAAVSVVGSSTAASIAGLEPDERYTASIVTGNGWGWSTPVTTPAATFGTGVAFDRYDPRSEVDPAITQSDYVNAYLLAVASKAVYGNPDEPAENQAEIIEGTFAGLGLRDVVYVDENSTNTQFAVGRRGNTIVVTFRGTAEGVDWLTDLGVGQFAFDTSVGPVWAHNGFSLALLSILERLQDELDAQRLAAPDASIVLTGHSLGGALAELAALRLHDAGYPIASVHTVGAPAIGGLPLTQAYDELDLGAVTHRWVNDHDAVPMAIDLVPLYTEVGRSHVFVRGVDAPDLDSATEPVGEFGFFDHDIAIYAENLRRQITDTTLLPPPPARLTDFVNSFDIATLRIDLIGWALGIGQRTDAEIAAFLLEAEIEIGDAMTIIVSFLADFAELERVVAILEDAYGIGAAAMAELLASVVPPDQVIELARALLAQYELAQNTLIDVLVDAGYDLAAVSAAVAALFDQFGADIADGLDGLAGQLASWATAFGFDGDASLLPTDLGALFGLDDVLGDLTFPSIDPAAGAAEVATAMETAGWTVDWVTAGDGPLQPPTDDDVIQLRRTITLESLASIAEPITPTATGLLDGLADALSLTATGAFDGSLTLDLVIGADTSGFYVDPSTTMSLDVGGSVAVADVATVAGVPATIAGTVEADATAAVSPASAERVRPGPVLPTFDSSLDGRIDTTLDADLGDVELTWTGAWDIATAAGMASAALRPGATLAGVATLSFFDPARQVALAGTFLGADGWRVDGTLVGTLSAAGLTVTEAAVEATLAPSGFTGTADLAVELAVGSASPITGNLVVDWSPAGTQLAGTIRLDEVVADPVARFDGITLEVATTGDGTTIDLVSDPDGTITLFPGVDLVTLEQPTGSLTADGVLTVGATTATALIAGGIVVSLDAPTITLDPDAVASSPILIVPSASATIPSLGDLTVTLVGLQVLNDGTVRVSEAIADPRAVTDTLGIAGLLPFDVNYVSVAFPDPSLPLDRFDATITGSFDFDALDGLPFTPVLTIGNREVDAADEGAAAEFTFTVRVDSSGEIRPVDLGPVTIGFADLAAGPVVVGATVTLGEYDDDGLLVAPGGLSTGQVSGAMSVVTTGNGLTGSVDAAVTGSLDVTPERTVLDLAARLVVSGAYEDTFTVEDLSLGVRLTVEADATGVAVTRFDVEDVTVGELAVALGDVARLTLRDATLAGGPGGFALAPAPGTDWITIGGTPDGPGAQIELLDDDLGEWGGGIGNVALRAVETDGGGIAIVPVVLPGFYADVTFPDDATFGFPDWLPLRFREAGLTFPSISPDDLTSAVELTPELLAGLRIRVSASLDGDGDTFPISGDVEGLEVDIGKLAAGQFPITNLDAAMFGIEPFDLGPMTVGGGLGLGVLDPDSDAPIFFGRIFGEFAYSGFGAGVDIVLTQYGPVLAKINAPTPIVLGNTGLMLSGVRGGIQFGGEGLVPPGDPRDLLGDSRYDLDVPISIDVIRASVESCIAKNAGRTGTPDASWPCFTWNDGGLVTIGTTITSYAAPGVVAADVDGAIDLRLVRDDDGDLVLGDNGLPVPPALRFAATGTVDIWGIDIADAAVLVAFDDPLAPTLDMATQMPGISGPIGFLIPATGDYTVHLGTDGIAAGAIEATRVLLESAASGTRTGSEALFADALDALAVTLERARTLTDGDGSPLPPDEARRVVASRLLVDELLDVDDSGQVEPDEERPIDRQFLLDRFLGGGGLPPLLPEIELDNVGDLASIAEPLTSILRGLQVALVAEAQRLVAADASDYPLTGPVGAEDLAVFTRAGVAFAEVMQQAVTEGIASGATAWAAVFDPVLRFEGGIQPVIAGVAFGEPTDTATFTIGRDQLAFGLSGSVESLFLSFWGGIGLATAELNKVFGVNSIVAAEGTLALPDVFEAVAKGDPMVLDPFDADWNVQLSMTTKVAGFTLQESRGVLIPPDLDPAELRQLVCRVDRPDIAPCGDDLIPVDGDEHWASIEDFGGLLLSYELLAPRIATDPAGVAAELRLDPPDEWLGWLDIIRTNFTAVTSLHTVGSYQIFLPSAQRYLDPLYVADQVWPVASTDLDRLGIETLDAALDAAEAIRGAFYAEGFWDVDLLGLPLAEGVISVDDDAFTVDAEFPMFGNVPVTVEFGGVTVTAGRDRTDLPVPGFDTTLSGADAAAALAGFGFPDVIDADTTGAIRVQAYGPGYHPASSVAIERDGGIQIDATLDLDGLVDDAAFTIAVAGTVPATADLRGVAAVESLGPFAGVTITDATIVIERTAGVWAITISGDASTPLGTGSIEAQLDASLEGSMTVRFDDSTLDLDGFEVDVVLQVTSTRSARGLSFSSTVRGELDVPALGWTDVAVDGTFDGRGIDRLMVSATQATFGPVQLTDGSFVLVRSPASWSLVVAATATIPGVLDAVSVNGSLAPDGTGSLIVTTQGSLRFGSTPTAPALTLTDPTASLVRTASTTRLSIAGDVAVLDQPLRVTGLLSISASATTGSLTVATTGVAFGAATIAGTFTVSVTASSPPLGTPSISAAVTFVGTASIPGIATALGVTGTISSTGDTTLTLDATSLTIQGFTLTDGTFTLGRTPLAPGAAGFSTTLDIDAEISVLGATATIDGTIDVTASALDGDIALSSASPYALGGFELSGGLRLVFDDTGASLGVASQLTVPGIVTDATVTGSLDWSAGTSGSLVGSLNVAAPSTMPLGGASSALSLGGSLTLARTVESRSVVTRLSVTGATVQWAGVDTFTLPDVTIATDGSFTATADADSITIGTFTLELPALDLYVGAAGAGTELHVGEGSLSIAGISPLVTIPAFDVTTSGDFAVDLPALTSLEIGGYHIDVTGPTFRFEREAGIFRLLLTGAGGLDVAGLPSPITLDSFALATNGTVAAGVSARRFGPAALNVRDASISFTRTVATGPRLTVSGGSLHLPVGEPIPLPTLTFSAQGTLDQTLNRALTLGPGLRVPTTGTNLPLSLVADDGVLALEQTAAQQFSTLLGSSLTLSGFRAASDGSFGGSIDGTVSPLGYQLADASFTISKPPGWVDARIELDDPVTANFGPASAAVDGWFATNGRFEFDASVSIDETKLTNLLDQRFLDLDGTASIELTNTGLTGSFSGSVSVPFFLCTATMSGAIDATGTLTGSFSCNPWGSNNVFTLGVEVKLFAPLPSGNDTTRPSVAPIDDIVIYGSVPTPVYFDVRASDDRDDSPTVTCRNSAGTIVASGSAFTAGPTPVTCTAADDASPANVSLPRTFTVTVILLQSIGYSIAVDGEPAENDDGRLELLPGSEVVAKVGGFQSGTTVTARFHSTPVDLGRASVADDGTVTMAFTVPDVAAGPHHLELTGLAPEGGALQIVIPVDVIAQAPPPTTVSTTVPAPTVPAVTAPTPTAAVPAGPVSVRQPALEPVSGLPRTGSDPAAPIAGALGLLAVGIVLSLVGRRRRAW